MQQLQPLWEESFNFSIRNTFTFPLASVGKGHLCPKTSGKNLVNNNTLIRVRENTFGSDGAFAIAGFIISLVRLKGIRRVM